MSKSSSRDVQLEDLGQLLKEARAQEGKIPGLKFYREILSKAYRSALSARSKRDTLSAATREATRDLNNSVITAQDAARRLRSYLRGALGPRADQLTSFGIKP